MRFVICAAFPEKSIVEAGSRQNLLTVEQMDDWHNSNNQKDPPNQLHHGCLQAGLDATSSEVEMNFVYLTT